MKKKTKTKAIAVGATVAAVLSAGAAIFLTQTKAGKKITNNAKEHAIELGQELSHRISKVKKMSKAQYDKIVSEIVEQYAKKRKLTTAKAKDVERELKRHYTDVKKHIKK